MKNKWNKHKYICTYVNIAVRWKKVFAAIIVCGIIGTLSSICAPNFLGMATDYLKDYIENNIQTDSLTPIHIYLFIALFLYVQANLFTYIQNQRSVVLSQKISYYLRKEMIRLIPVTPYQNFEKQQVGDILSRFTNDINLIGENLPTIIINFLTFFVYVLGISIVVLFINFTIGFIYIVLLVVSILFILLIMKFSQPYFTLQQKSLGDISSLITESFEGQDSILAYNAQNVFNDKFIKLNNFLYKSGFKSLFLSNFILIINNIFYMLSFSIIIIFGVKFVINGSMTLGELQTLLMYSFLNEMPLAKICSTANLCQQVIASGKRISDYLDGEKIDKSNWYLTQNDIKDYNVRIRNLNFCYVRDLNIIHDISIDIPYKHKLAIIGPTGSGKTTIAKLLLGLYDNYEGSIKIGDCEIKNMDHIDLRELVGVVPQDMWIQTGSIINNISFSDAINSDEDEDRLQLAIKMACADQVVNKFKEKYQYVIKEDKNSLSKGELQLLNIARIFYLNRKIIIFDEATSYIDINTEHLIQKAIDNLSKNHTLIIIAHRLSTIINCDSIIYLENGTIKEAGTHKELMTKKGSYYKMYKSQYLH